MKITNYKVVLQKRNYDCGVAATKTLLLNAGLKVGYKRLEKKLNLSKDGVSCSSIARYLKTYKALDPKVKFNCSVKSLERELKQGKICMVVYQSWGKPEELKALECGHYSVCVKVTKTKVYLLDPGAYKNWGDGIGWRIMSLKEFKEKWIDKDFRKIVKGWMLSVKPQNLKS